MYIFLDIDGVLVREDRPGSPTNEDDITVEDLLQFNPECQKLFEDVIVRHDHARIVISSSWIEIWPIETIRPLFSVPVASKVEGATPRETVWVEFYRHVEVLNYIERHNATGIPWVAIDDIREHFRPGAPVLVTDPYEGFTCNDAKKLDYFLTHGSLPDV